MLDKEDVKAAQCTGISEEWILSSVAVGKVTIEEAKCTLVNGGKDFKSLIYKHFLNFKERDAS
jgi:hypothetical protein